MLLPEAPAPCALGRVSSLSPPLVVEPSSEPMLQSVGGPATPCVIEPFSEPVTTKFTRLFEQAHEAYRSEVAQLRGEISRLQSQLETSSESRRPQSGTSSKEREPFVPARPTHHRVNPVNPHISDDHGLDAHEQDAGMELEQDDARVTQVLESSTRANSAGERQQSVHMAPMPDEVFDVNAAGVGSTSSISSLRRDQIAKLEKHGICIHETENLQQLITNKSQALASSRGPADSTNVAKNESQNQRSRSTHGLESFDPSRMAFKGDSRASMNASDFKSPWQRAQWRLSGIVEHPTFESGFGALIMMNAVTMAFQVQYTGIEVGYSLQYRGSSRPAADAWPGCEDVLEVFDWVFGCIFLLEVTVKIIALSSQFFCRWYNWMDLSIVVFFLLEKISVGSLHVSPLGVRLLRLSRLARLLRLVRSLESFDALFLILTALKGSMSILAWAFLVLLVLQLIMGLLVSQILHATYFIDENQPFEQRREVYAYFGTMTRSLLSMFELALANWPPVCRLLSENISEWFMLLGLIHKLTIGFAVVGIINGVFMQETFKVAAQDNTLMVRNKRKAVRLHAERMKALFSLLDTSEDGNVDFEEFSTISQHPAVQTWLASMELPTDNVSLLFHLIDADHSGTINVEELIAGVGRLQGAARSLDLLNMLTNFAELGQTKDQGSAASASAPLPISQQITLGY